MPRMPEWCQIAGGGVNSLESTSSAAPYSKDHAAALASRPTFLAPISTGDTPVPPRRRNVRP